MTHEQKYFEALQVNVFANRRIMGDYAALEAAGAIKRLSNEKDEINILFAAAPSQDDFLRALLSDKSIPWEKINAFQLDEYIGIRADAPQRFAGYLSRTILDAVPLREFYAMDCESTDIKKEIERYSRELAAHPADIAFIGIGENGHIAFNDPGIADFEDKLAVKEVLLDERSRRQQVNDKCFDRIELVPKSAITLTIPAIISCDRIFCIVPGPSKAQAVYDTLYAEKDRLRPSTILRGKKGASLYLDADSAAMLKDFASPFIQTAARLPRLVIVNGKVVMPDRVIPLGGVSVRDGKIDDVFAGTYRPGGDERVIDAAGRYISPGFIDIHVHGGDGEDFLCGEAEGAMQICKFHMRHGTTSILPTISSSDMEGTLKSIAAVYEAKSAPERESGPDILGLHLEGPYISLSQRGAQDVRFIRDPNPAEYMRIADALHGITRWTAAPELPGAPEMARAMRAKGVRMSIGHSDALCDEVARAFELGFETVTHLYSGTSIVKRINAYRYAGVVEAAFLMDDMMVEVIADGKHLPQSLLKLIYKIKGPDRICLVSDAISAAGLSDTQSEIYSMTCGCNIIIEDGVAMLPDRTAFAGSVATTNRLVRTMATLGETPLEQAVRMATATPARNIGVFDRKGSLAQGKDADIVLFDGDVNVSMVMVNGKITFDDSPQASRNNR